MTQRITILGGGPGGYGAAFSAAAKGADVTLIEQARSGGTCLHHGCIPSKTLKSSSDALGTARRLVEFGIQGGQEAQPDMPAIMQRKDTVVETLCTGLEKGFAKRGIRYVQGAGKITARNEVLVRGSDAEERIAGDKLIIATGSKVSDLPTVPFDHKRVLSSDDILALQEIPESLVIIGAGVIGCEMAFLFQALGTKVTLVEGLSRVLPLPGVDSDVSKLLRRELKKKGIACHLEQTVSGVDVHENFVRVHVAAAGQDAAQPGKTLQAQMVLVAVGRKAVTDDLGLQDVGVQLDERGWILVNEYLETSVSGIYAVGDVLGPKYWMLAHVALAEGRVAALHCLGEDTRMDYTAVPGVIFTSPEIGCVGLTEEEAIAQGYTVRCPQMPMRALGKAQAMGELAGLFKFVFDAETNRLLGAHIAGPHASDCIAEATLGLQMGATDADILRTIHAHPTIAEGFFETLLHV